MPFRKGYYHYPGSHHDGAGRWRPCSLTFDEYTRRRFYSDYRSYWTRTKYDKELSVEEVDLLKDDNRKAHDTEEYEAESLVLRRGWSFDVHVKLSRRYRPYKDEVSLEFATGRNPSVTKFTMIQIPKISTEAEAKRDPYDWSAFIKENDGMGGLTIRVTSSSRAVVADYKMIIKTKGEGEDEPKNKIVEDNKANRDKTAFILIFNAFNKDDDCYMENGNWRNEYVMNDVGHIWVGSAQRNRPRRWNFYQVNNNDEDNGVLVGNWSGKYSLGTAPTSWIGSTKILEEYLNSKQPVKYGQCWVFSGVTTTLCRALGMPTRSVTNFQSAHDTDISTTIDTFFYEGGKPFTVEGKLMQNDSIWNFHVWNECWFKRRDLPQGYDGWQVIDATPQETSGGIYQCGPAPVVAVKQGDVYLPYDCHFAFGEVNGDKINWMVRKDETVEIISMDKQAVGKLISTRAIDSTDTKPKREDITRNYKFKEGSPEERKAVERAYSFGEKRENKIYDTPLQQDVAMTENFPFGVEVGSDVIATVDLHNKSNELRKLAIRFTNCFVFYTGVPVSDGNESIQEIELKPKEKRSVSHEIKATDYLKDIVAETSLRIFAEALVYETQQRLVVSGNVEFDTPGVQLKAPRKARPDEEFTMTVSIVNPLQIRLTHAAFCFEGKGLDTKGEIIRIRDPIQPHSEEKRQFKLKAKRKGNLTIGVTFTSREMDGQENEVTLGVE